jgi:hypothetical protein
VGEYIPATGWQLLNGADASALDLSPSGAVLAARFPGRWVGDFPPASWRPLTGANASLQGADALGSVFGGFAGFGVWEYDPSRG